MSAARNVVLTVNISTERRHEGVRSHWRGGASNRAGPCPKPARLARRLSVGRHNSDSCEGKGMARDDWPEMSYTGAMMADLRRREIAPRMMRPKHGGGWTKCRRSARPG